MPAFILWSMKKSTLPSKNAAKPTQRPSSQPVQRCAPCDSAQDQLPHTPAQLASPSYQDMADQSPQVQEAAALQLAADSLAAPMTEEPPLQGWFTWKGTRIDSKHFGNFQDRNPDIFKNKNNARLLKQSDKSPARIAAEAAMAKEWDELKACAEDPNDQGTVQMGQGKAELIQILRNYQKKKAKAQRVTAATDLIERQAMLNESGVQDETPYPAMGRELVELNAFPVENIKELVKDATKSEGGFITEIMLALQLARKHPLARVQIGVVPKENLKDFLGYEPTASQDKILGHPGGDVTVWYDPNKYPDEKTMFIQSKMTFVPENITGLMGEAGNQLTGNNASGATTTNTDAVKEGTFTGPGYQGVAFGRVEGAIDPDVLKGAAQKAFTAGPKHVHRVVFEVVDHTGTYYYEYDRATALAPNARGDKKSSSPASKTHPLMITKAVAPKKEEKEKASPASADASASAATFVAKPTMVDMSGVTDYDDEADHPAEEPDDDIEDAALIDAGIRQSLNPQAQIPRAAHPMIEVKRNADFSISIPPTRQADDDEAEADSKAVNAEASDEPASEITIEIPAGQQETAAATLSAASSPVSAAEAAASATAEDVQAIKPEPKPKAEDTKASATAAKQPKKTKNAGKQQKVKRPNNAAKKKARRQAQKAQNADADGDEEAS